MIEILGYVASVLVAVSLLTTSILRLRLINLVGAVAFTAYGVLIHAYPVAAVNFVIVLINLYRLRELWYRREYFRLLEVSPQSEYLAEFLKFHAADIQRFNPGFDPARPGTPQVFFVLRDMIPTGLILAVPEGPDALRLDVDYVIPGYRDLKVARFVFEDNAALFAARGIRRIWSPPGNDAHEAYLQRVGFTRETRPDGSALYRLDVRS